jgi:hypothetical protein
MAGEAREVQVIDDTLVNTASVNATENAEEVDLADNSGTTRLKPLDLRTPHTHMARKGAR